MRLEWDSSETIRIDLGKGIEMMMMINRVNTMTPRQNDLVVKNLVFLEPKLEILKQKSSLIHVWT